MTSAAKIFTREDVAQHKTKNDNYIILHGQVYNVSEYVEDHPGGKEILLSVAGQDGTEDFDDIGHSDEAKKRLETLWIGSLEGVTKTAPQPLQTIAEQPERAHRIPLGTTLLLWLGCVAGVLTGVFFMLVAIGLMSDENTCAAREK